MKITEDVRTRLADLETNGRLTPEAVVEDARDEHSPLHDFFEWDDSEASHQYRLWQARTVIKSVNLVTVTSDKITIKAPFYVRDPSALHKEQGYVSVLELKKDPIQARESLRLEFGRAESALVRAQNVASALGLEDEIAHMIARLVAIRESIAA